MTAETYEELVYMAHFMLLKCILEGILKYLLGHLLQDLRKGVLEDLVEGILKDLLKVSIYLRV